MRWLRALPRRIFAASMSPTTEAALSTTPWDMVPSRSFTAS